MRVFFVFFFFFSRLSLINIQPGIGRYFFPGFLIVTWSGPLYADGVILKLSMSYSMTVRSKVILDNNNNNITTTSNKSVVNRLYKFTQKTMNNKFNNRSYNNYLSLLVLPG